MKQGALAPVFSYTRRACTSSWWRSFAYLPSRLTNSRTVEGSQREGNRFAGDRRRGFTPMKNEPGPWNGQPWSLDGERRGFNRRAEDSSSSYHAQFLCLFTRGEKVCDVTAGMWSLWSLHLRRWDFSPRVVKIYLPLAESSITTGMIVESGKGWRIRNFPPV